jgi:O-antigen/teichoic acid export membrane protein
VPLLDVPRIVCSAALQGERRMPSLARIDMGQELCRLVFVVAGALILGSADGAVGGMLAASACGGALALDAYRRERLAPDSALPSLWTALRSRSVPARRALREGVQVGLVRNVDALGVQTFPTLILGSLGNRDWVAYLKIAQRMVAVARLLMQGINRTALPALAQLAGVRDIAGLRRTYWKASFLSGATITAGVLLTLPILPFVIERLFPRDFAGPVWTMILILAPGLCIVSFSVANDVFYLVTQQMRVAILLSIVGLFVNTAQVALFAWWLPTIGVAIGLTVTCLWSLVHMAYAWNWFRRHPELRSTAP